MSADREAWVKALAARFEEKVFALDAAFDGGFSDDEGKVAWLVLAEIAAEETEKLARLAEGRALALARDLAEALVASEAERQGKPLDSEVKIAERPLPWREALEDKAR